MESPEGKNEILVENNINLVTSKVVLEVNRELKIKDATTATTLQILHIFLFLCISSPFSANLK